MPLGHNRRDPEFGKVVPDGCHPELVECPALAASQAPGCHPSPGPGPAILLSLGLHVLVGLWFWHGLSGREKEDGTAARIVDTRAKQPGLEVEVCLKLLDSPKPGLKKESSHPVSSLIRSSPANPEVSDLPKTSRVAGAESSKPRHGYQDLPRFAGASKTQPRPPEARLPILASQTEYFPPGDSLTGSASGLGVGDGATSFFHIAARAKSVVYVIDRSVSMGPSGGLARAKQELLASLQGMPDQTQFQIIIFNRSVEMLSLGSATGLLPATKANKEKAAEFLAPIQPEGGTLPVPALRRALALKPEVIFFLSDGGDWTDRLVQEVISVNRGHSVIHVVDFGGGVRDQLNGPLRVLASKNQGEYRAVARGGNEPWPIRGN